MNNCTLEKVSFKSTNYSLFWMDLASSTVNIFNSSFKDITCSENGQGGVIHARVSNDGLFFVANNTFMNIHSRAPGSAIYTNMINLSSSSFTNCSSSSSDGGGGGGGICFYFPISIITLSNSLFENCSSVVGRGGAIYIVVQSSNFSFVFVNVSFLLNKAQSYKSNDIFVDKIFIETLSKNFNFTNVCTDILYDSFNYGSNYKSLDGLLTGKECELNTNCSSLDINEICSIRKKCILSPDNTSCVDDACTGHNVKDDCAKNYNCVNYNGLCVYYLNGYCENRDVSKCEDEYCSLQKNKCVYSGCRYVPPDEEGDCVDPCVKNSSDGTCDFNPCVTYADDCVNQTEEGCRFNEKRECVVDNERNECKNYLFDEVMCVRDGYCFWDVGSDSSLHCEKVAVKLVCDDCINEKECSIALGCENNKSCRCEWKGGRCSLMVETVFDEKLRTILIIICGSGIFIIALFIVIIIVVVVVRRSNEKKTREKNDLDAKLYDHEDGEVDAFYANAQDFIA
jgi:hypothetical protein